MKRQNSISARRRCSIEKKRLDLAVGACDYCSDSYKKHHKCYQSVAKEIKRRMHNCLIA
jgi:hypothetical protein